MQEETGQHLEAHEGQDDRDALVEMGELLLKSFEEEVQATQAEHCHRVGREGNVRVLRDSQHRGNRVDCEEQVYGLDHRQAHHQRRHQDLAGLADDERCAVVLMRHRQHPAEEAVAPHLLDFDLLLGCHHPDGGVHQESAEDRHGEVEPLDRLDAQQDESQSHHECAEDAPKEHLVLICPRHPERLEDNGDDKQVVDAQRPLQHVRRSVLRARTPAELVGDEPEHGCGHRDPQQRLHTGFPCGKRFVFAIEHKQVQDEQDGNEATETHPVPGARVGRIFMDREDGHGQVPRLAKRGSPLSCIEKASGKGTG